MSSASRLKAPRGPSDTHNHTVTVTSKLKQEEQRIDLKVLHHLNRDDHSKKQKRFKRTVMAVHAIVSNKLYKSKASSLEAYFRDAWKISRAQVYRFLDCALVLKHLESFPEQPCRERLCRSLKRLAKNRTDTQKLWEAVLSKVNNDHEAVTSTIINSVWKELLDAGLVTGKPASGEELVDVDHDVGNVSDIEVGAADQDCDSDIGEGENIGGYPTGMDSRRSFHDNFSIPQPQPSQSRPPIPAYQQFMPADVSIPDGRPRNTFRNDGRDWNADNMDRHAGINGRSIHVAHQETKNPHMEETSSLLQSLAAKGCNLQPYVDGRWVTEPINSWRLVSSQGENFTFNVPNAPVSRSLEQPNQLSTAGMLAQAGPGKLYPHQQQHHPTWSSGEESTIHSNRPYAVSQPPAPSPHYTHGAPAMQHGGGASYQTAPSWDYWGYGHAPRHGTNTGYPPFENPSQRLWESSPARHRQATYPTPQQAILYDSAMRPNCDTAYNHNRALISTSHPPLSATFQHTHQAQLPLTQPYPTGQVMTSASRGRPLEPQPATEPRYSNSYYPYNSLPPILNGPNTTQSGIGSTSGGDLARQELSQPPLTGPGHRVNEDVGRVGVAGG